MTYEQIGIEMHRAPGTVSKFSHQVSRIYDQAFGIKNDLKVVCEENDLDKTKNMTVGNPFRLLFLFSLPLMAGNVFQELYTIADTAIVGRIMGVDALAALGAVSWNVWFFMGIIQGMTQGFSILIAQKFGAGKLDEMREAAGNALVLSSISGIFLLVIAELSVRPFLSLIRIPSEIQGIGSLYIRVLFCGLPAVVAYNIFAAILRALGDSKNPLYAMILAACTNIALDFLFILFFHWGVAGAAAATVFSQLLAAVFCFIKIRNIPSLCFGKTDFIPQISIIRYMEYLAMPMAFQNLVIAVGGIIVQAVVNRYGVSFIAGYTTTTKMYGLLESAAISYGFAMVTYSGQNMGAGNHKRISQGLRASLLISFLTSSIITITMFVFGRQLLSLFMDPASQDGLAALQTGYLFLRIMAAFLPVLYILHVVRSCIQGMGNTVIPMLSGISEFFMRTGTAFLLPAFIGELGILFAEVIAWSGADFILIPGYFMVKHKNEKRLQGRFLVTQGDNHE